MQNVEQYIEEGIDMVFHIGLNQWVENENLQRM